MLTVTFLISLHAENDSVHIDITAQNLKGKKILLGSYFNGKVLIIDSLYLSSEGTGVFRKKDKYPEGEYLLHLLIDTVKLHARTIQFLLAAEQVFSITIDTTDYLGITKISGAKQTEALLNYSRFLQAKQKERNLLIDELKILQESRQDTAKVKSQLDVLNKEVKQYQEHLAGEYKGKWVASFLQGVEPPSAGTYFVPASREEYEKEFRYQKSHFFDNIDLQDSRFWRTSYFPQKINEYMEKWVEPNPDSLAHAASRLVAKTMGDSICFNLMFNRLMNYSLSNKKMGSENIWMKLMEDYYHTGWINRLDFAEREQLDTEYQWLKNNRIGQQAKNLDLLNIDNKPVNLYQLGEKYTLLYFYDPTCYHCMEMTRNLYGIIYKKYAGKGLDVVAMCIMKDENEWIAYIHKNQFEGEHWHNVWDPSEKSFFWLYYDTRSTPVMYVLDENKKIIAKKIDIDSLNKLFDWLLSG